MSERLVILARGLAVATLGLLVAACPGREEPPPAPPEQPAPTPIPEPPAPTALSRSDILAAARAAASGYAQGAQGDERDELVGRSFAIVIPVGCGGPMGAMPAEAADGLARLAWGPERRTLQFSLTPGDWTQSALITSAGGDWESVEGVWIPRPWLDSEACPSVRADPLQSGASAAAPQTVGLAVVHTDEDSRLDRRAGRAWAHTIRGEGEAAATLPEGGLRLRFEGRVSGFPNGRAFRCRAAGPDTAPVCVIAIELDRVALEAGGGEALSEWRGG